MAYNIPKLGKDADAAAEFTNIILRGETDLRDTLKIDEVAVTSVANDLNLLAGMAAASLSPVKCLEVEVDCGAGGTAQTAVIGTIPLGSVILDVSTYCSEAFNGNTTTTFEVGVAANTDNYVDPVDCPVTLAGVMDTFGGTNNDQKVVEVCAAAVDIIATWTNTAAATAGKVVVKVIYI